MLRLFSATFVFLVLAMAVRADLVISEFCADNNSTLVDGLSATSDWIEIHNPTPATVDLAGWKLRASADTWTFPAVMLPSGGFLVVFASGKLQQPYTDPAGYFHATFRLDAAGEPLALLRPDGSVAHEYAAPLPAQREDVSYGLTQAATPFVTFDSTAKIHVVGSGGIPAGWNTGAAFNDASWLTGKAAAGFGSATPGGPAVKVAYRVLAGTVGVQDFGGSLGMDFIVNEPVHLTELGCFDSGSNGLSSTIVVQLWTRNTNGTVTNYADDTGMTIVASQSFTTASPGTALEGSRFKTLPSPVMLAPGSYTIVAYGYSATEPIGNAGGASSAWETNSGGGKLTFVGGGRFGTAGFFPNTLDGGPVNRYAAGTFKFAGANDPVARTVIQSSMLGLSPTALMRASFTVANPALFDFLLLDLPYDDGCNVWLNGTLIANRNLPVSGAASARASIPVPASRLVAGTNLLAIQGANVAASDADFFIGAQLTGVKTDAATVRHFPTPTPGAPNPATGVAGYVADTVFSVNRGFFDAPFALTITCATPGATIRYTLDGTPPTETTGTIYTTPLNIATTTTVRALAYKAGLEKTNVDTHTYLFANDVAIQPSSPPPGYPASWTDYSNGGTVVADYGMIATGTSGYALSAGSVNYTPAQARTAIANSIRALPVLSIVTDKANFFDPATGIYLWPTARGESWERPCSVELLTANGSETFHINAGIHIMGFSSRNLNTTPKLNMMLVFGSQYGANWLNHEFFGSDGPSRHKRIALRSNTRDGWLAEAYGPATYLVDGWAKDAQLASGHPATRHRFMHVFINGLYWGLYNPTERPQEHWAETTLGGEDEEYDIINLCCNNRLDAGDFTEWNELMARSSAGFATTAAYQEVQGNNPDGTRNPAFKKLLDVDNLLSHLINGYYHTNGDWPGNFFVAYDNVQTRTPGFRFITWDNDLAFQGFSLNANKVTPPEGFTHVFWLTSPGQVDAGLRGNADYRARLADTVYRWFFHGGPYDTAVNIARWNALKAQVQPGLYAESCRWGDYRGPVKTVQNDWMPRVTTTALNYFNQRNNVVLSQLRSAGLYPNLNPPEFNLNGGVVPSNFTLQLTGPVNATIYYSVNGADPRLPGGGIAPGMSTTVSGGTRLLTQTCTVRARAKDATEWSALHEATFIVGNAANAGELTITEFDYHPADPSAAEFAAGHTSASLFEYVELTNTTAQTLDLTGVHFTSGVQFTFPNARTLAPGASVLVVKNSAAFLFRHGSALAPLIAGVFENDSGLSDNGEGLALADNANAAIITLTYDDGPIFPPGADGTGSALVLSGADPANGAHWRTSLAATPGERATLQTEWLRKYFTAAERANPAIAGDLADPDGDGLKNLAEFATGSDPRNPASGPDAVTLALQQITISGATDIYPVLTVRRAVDTTLAITIQSSANLAAWTDAGLVSLATSDPRTGFQTIQYRAIAPLPANARTYWRLRASAP